MTIFALSENDGLLVTIAAIVSGITSIITAIGGTIIAIIQAKQRKSMSEVVNTQKTQNEHLSSAITNIKKIELATNSMKDQLVAKTEQEALARGGIEERARADARSTPQ